MTSDLLFVYGTLMRGFDHPMASCCRAGADFIGEARCRGRLYLVKHYPGLVLSDDADEVVFGELYRLRARAELLREFDMYEACGEGFASADRICPPDAARDIRRWRRERGLDLSLQLAGRPSAAHRVGAVYGEVARRVPDAVQRLFGCAQSRDHTPVPVGPGSGAQHAASASRVCIRGTMTVCGGEQQRQARFFGLAFCCM